MGLKFDIQRHSDSGFLMDNLKGFVPKIQSDEIIKATVRGSSVLRLSKVEVMTSDNKTFPLMTQGPGAYWVAEAGRIRTDLAQWEFPEMVAKKIAVIVPVTEEKIKDSTINVFDEIKTYISEAFMKAIDLACLFGVNSPFATNVYSSALTNSMAIAKGTNAKLDLDIADTMALVEAQGYDVGSFIAGIGFKNSLRKLRDADGNQLYVNGVTDKGGNTYDTLYSLPIEFSRNGAWDDSKALCIAGDFKHYSVIGIRDQIQYKVLDEATLHSVTLTDGMPLSLAENDMIGLKVTMRIGFLVVRPQAFAVLVPPAETPSTDTSVTPSTP